MSKALEAALAAVERMKKGDGSAREPVELPRLPPAEDDEAPAVKPRYDA